MYAVDSMNAMVDVAERRPRQSFCWIPKAFWMRW